MDQSRRVNINGRHYDMVTGLPIDTSVQPAVTPSRTAAKRPVAAGNVHTLMQKSQTLRRASLKPPVAAPKSIHQIVTHKTAPAQPAVAKSPQIARFTPQHATATAAPKMMDIGPMRHPVVAKAQATMAAKAAPAPVKPSQVIKQEIIRHAIDNTVKQPPLKKSFHHPRVTSILTAAVALFILGGYLTYLNMPSLSVRVAAAAAGVDASYPNYRPDGYQLNGPVVYDKGQVSIKFAATAGPQNFTIKQSKSSWDSAAVLDNYVLPKAGNDYATYTERGLTIYTFDGGVAWVNGGVLYTIDGNAPLSSEQIRHLATSFI